MNGLRKKMQKTSVFGHFWSKRTILDSFWPKWAKREIFFKKAHGKFLSRLQTLTNCKVSEKSNERFSSNRLTHVRTDGCTYGRTHERTQILRSPTTSSRDQKSLNFISSVMTSEHGSTCCKNAHV